MVVYHGTTRKHAEVIRIEGFRPRGGTHRVWFSQTVRYAKNRANMKAQRANDQPIVLTCELDLTALRNRLGARRVHHQRRIISIEGPVPPSVLVEDINSPGMLVPRRPKELARWLNRLLGIESYRGLGRDHPGVDRLARWIDHRISTYPGSALRKKEVLEAARQWLPNYFKMSEPDFERLSGWPEEAFAGEAPKVVAPPRKRQK